MRSDDEIVVTGSDLKILFFRLLPRLKIIACLAAVFSLLFVFLKGAQFKTEATFQLRKDPANTQVVFKEVFHVLGARIPEPSPIPALLSKELCLDVIEQLGLQIESDRLVFKQVRYIGSDPLHLFFKGVSDRRFEILDQDQRVLFQGEVNQVIDTPLFQAELSEIPSLIVGKCYPLVILPQETAVSRFQSVFRVKPSLIGDHIFEFRFKSKTHRLANRVIKQVILSYQKMIRLEQERSLDTQIEYLTAREVEYTRQAEEELGASPTPFGLFNKHKHTHLLDMMSQLIEAKKMEKDLLIHALAPVELVYQVIDSRKRDGVIYPLLTAFFFCGFFYLFHLGRTLFSGVPVSQETLRLLGCHSLGKLSIQSERGLSGCQNMDVQTLQNVSQFLFAQQGGLCAIIGGKNPNFSKALAELLHLQGLRVLLIEDVFGEEKAAPIINHLEKYDYAVYQHGIEMLKPTSFSKWLSLLQPNYDRILIYTQADAQSAQGKLYVQLMDVALISTSKETKEQLSHYLQLHQTGSPKKVAFLSSTLSIFLASLLIGTPG